MKMYKVKLAANDTSIFEFMRFAEKNNVTIYVSYQQEDIFADLIFLFVTVASNDIALFEGKYGKHIVKSENL